MPDLVEIYAIPSLPPPGDFGTLRILRALVDAKSALAEVKGTALSIPNPGLLIDTLSIQEAQASSEIENIVTTQDALFRGDLFPDDLRGPAKEVFHYRDALKSGFAQMQMRDGLIPNSLIIQMFRVLKDRSDGFRVLPGTALKHDRSGAIVYVPPQSALDIERHMRALEAFVNDDALSPLDPLIKMAIIHHQFESIHPFPDGNGRLGRILNVLYLSRSGLLDAPILYLSRHINRTKDDYYRLLQAVRDNGAWEDWVVYILEAVTQTSRNTLRLINGLRILMAEAKQRLRRELPKIYSQDLLNNMFRHPYTRIDFVRNELSVSRPTATRYLELMTEKGLVEKHQSWRDKYYINRALVQLLADTA